MKLYKTIKKKRIKSISVDIFDTILFRNIYPEDIQFLIQAKKSVRIIEDKLGIKIRPEYFYQLRKHVRKNLDCACLLNGHDPEPTITEIFFSIMDIIIQKNKTDIKNIGIMSIVYSLIKAELAVEKENLIPNKKLIHELRAVKESLKIKVFFISDMYLSKEHIFDILKHFNISDIFDDGYTSSQIRFGKGSCKIFSKVIDNPLAHLHIGDNYFADYRNPKNLGMDARWHRTFYTTFWKPIKMVFGKSRLRIMMWNSRQEVKKAMNKHIRFRKSSFSEKEYIVYKDTFYMTLPLLDYIISIKIIKKILDLPVVFLSSEGVVFNNIRRRLNLRFNSKILNEVNRENILKAYVYLAIDKSAALDYDLLTEFLWLGGNKTTMTDWLLSTGLDPDKEYISMLMLNCSENKDNFLCRKLLSEPKVLSALKISADEVTALLEKHGILDNSSLILSDIGWNGTIQILLYEIVHLLKGRSPKYIGYYFGQTGTNVFKFGDKNIDIFGYFINKNKNFDLFTAEIWEYCFSDNKSTDPFKAIINTAINHACHFYQEKTDSSPGFLTQIALPHIKRFLYNPDKKQTVIWGNIYHDSGMGINNKRRLFDNTYTTLFLIRLLIFNRKEFRRIISQQYWINGFCKYYGIKKIIDIYRLIKRWYSGAKNV